MTTTFSWSISAMYTVQQPDPNYVVNVLWTLSGADGSTNSSIGGNTTFTQNQSQAGFVPYDQLTEEIVIGWVQASLGEEGIAKYEALVQRQIDLAKIPDTTPQSTPLPWVAPAA